MFSCFKFVLDFLENFKLIFSPAATFAARVFLTSLISIGMTPIA